MWPEAGGTVRGRGQVGGGVARSRGYIDVHVHVHVHVHAVAFLCLVSLTD